MHLRRESGAHIDSVRARDPGLRMPSSSGRAISASFAEISDETRIKNRDRLSSRSSRVWTIVGYLRCLVTAKTRPVWKSKFYGAFVLHHRVVLHAIDATPARWHGDADSSPLDGTSAATPSLRNDLVKNCRVH